MAAVSGSDFLITGEWDAVGLLRDNILNYFVLSILHLPVII